MTFMPGIQDRLNIRKILIQRRPSDTGVLGDLRHRHRSHSPVGNQACNRIQNRTPHGPSMLFDGFIPQLRHAQIIRSVAT